jgi:histidyl-tRNA synthetase
MAKKSLIQAPKGTRDLLPKNQKYWQHLRMVAQKHLEANGFSRIDLPVIEYKTLFEKGVGETSDIVEKQMYVIPSDKEERELALRPEFTAGIARSYIENGMQGWTQPVMLYYSGPVFRKEKPQQGRWRQHYQYGLEIIGSDNVSSDAHAIKVLWDILTDIGFEKLTVKINTIGCAKCRPDILEELANYYQSRKADLCDLCLARLHKNPLRLLDCKEEKCQKISEEAPQIIDITCDQCQEDFKNLLELLDELEIKYDLDNKLVRGLDYYTKTVFEIKLGKYKNSLAGGGRYDNLIESYGGRSTPSMGWSMGMDRVVSMMKKEEITVPDRSKVQVFLAQLGKEAKKKAFKIMDQLQEEEIPTRTALAKNSLRDQLKMANKSGAKLTLILGEKELQDGTIIIRDMEEGTQDIVPLKDALKKIKKKINKL